jgi:arginase
MGVVAAATAAVEHLVRPELDGFFIHVDADCLDDAVMPAVEYRIPDGLTPEELSSTLKIALATGKAVGIEVTVYNPRLDKNGDAGRVLARALADSLGSSAQVA